MIQTIRKMFKVHGINSLYEYIGNKIQNDFQAITDDTPVEDLPKLVSHNNPLTRALVNLRLADKSVYSTDAAAIFQQMYKKYFDENSTELIDISFQQGICYACAKSIEDILGSSIETQNMLFWAWLDLTT